MMFCSSGVAPGASRPEVGRHPAPLVEVRRVHLVVDALRLERDATAALPDEGVEPELVAALLAIRANPSHLAVGLVGLLQSPLATKFVP